jgi:hypothetical protein
MRGRLFGVLALMLLTMNGSAALARNGDDRREVEGRSLFAKGDYQAALDIFATLFADKSDPVYLRNIGRCYQKLDQPAKSIDAFREYLRRGKVKGAERAEVEGFIQEMEELQKRQATTTPPPPDRHPEPAPEAAAPPPVAVATAPVEVAGGSAPGATLSQPAAPPDESSASKGSITHRWWFWTGLAVLVAGGVTVALLVTRSQGGTVPSCPSGVDCQNP